VDPELLPQHEPEDPAHDHARRSAEGGLEVRLGAADLVDAARGHDRAVLDHRDAVAHLLRDVEEVGRHEDCSPWPTYWRRKSFSLRW